MLLDFGKFQIRNQRSHNPIKKYFRHRLTVCRKYLLIGFHFQACAISQIFHKGEFFGYPENYARKRSQYRQIFEKEEGQPESMDMEQY